MLKEGTNYTMIRRAKFGKVHGHGVKEILAWLVAPRLCSLALGWLDLYGYGVITDNEFIIYIACSAQSDCISFFRDPYKFLSDPLESEFMSVM